jgi:two-component system, OmpR family, response regulator
MEMVNQFNTFTLVYNPIFIVSLVLSHMRQTALIVEDDPGTRHLLGSTLSTAGIDSIFAENGAAMWRQLGENPDVVILDLGLPDTDGLELLRLLRQQSEIPVLIHSTRSDEIERIIGIEIGADDFLPKPCNLRELVARTRRLIIRSQNQQAGQRNESQRVRFGHWTLNTASRELTDANGKPVPLGVSAFALLSAFLERPFEPLSREHLSRALKREYTPYDRIIDVHVSQIRRTLGKQTDGSCFIKTLRSQGYVFVAGVENTQ